MEKKEKNVKPNNTNEQNNDVGRLTRAQKVRSWSVINAIVCGAAVIGLGTVLTIKIVDHFKNQASVKVTFATRDDSVTIVGPRTVYVKKDIKFSDFNKPVATSNSKSFAYWTMSDDNAPVDTDYVVKNDDVFYAVMTPGPIEVVDGVYSYITSQGQWGKLTFDDHAAEPQEQSIIQFTLENGNTYELKRHEFNEPIVIGGKCEEIPNYFLSNCTHFNQQIFIPSGVHKIGDYFMSHCASYSQPISIPDNVSVIGNYFMWNCTDFNQQIRFSYDLVKIGDNFLKDCTKFNSNILFPKGNPVPKFEEIGNDFLSGCTAFNKTLAAGDTGIYGIPYTIKKIGNNFLKGCSSFNQNINIPTDLTELGSGFLSGCEKYNHTTTINCANLTKIADNFMEGCSGNTGQVIIKSPITFIGNHFMENCSSFNRSFVYNPGTSDPQNAFKNVTHIGSHFMFQCTSYVGLYEKGTEKEHAGINLPSKIEFLGLNFLQNCDALERVDINFDVTDSTKEFPQENNSSILSTLNSDAKCYKNGIAVQGDGAKKFKEYFQQLNGPVTYRKYK